MKPDRLTPSQQSASATLDAALASAEPACADDARFVADDPPEAALAWICASCPVLVECGAYAKAVRPRAGFWAGRQRGRSTTETTTKEKEAS